MVVPNEPPLQPDSLFNPLPAEAKPSPKEVGTRFYGSPAINGGPESTAAPEYTFTSKQAVGSDPTAASYPAAPESNTAAEFAKPSSGLVEELFSQQIKGLESFVQLLSAQLRNKDSEIEHYKNQIAAKDHQILHLQQEILGLQQTIRSSSHINQHPSKSGGPLPPSQQSLLHQLISETPQPAAKALNTYQLKRLAMTQSRQQDEWITRHNKLASLQQAFILESNANTKLQLEQEIQAAITEMARLEEKLIQIEQTLEEHGFSDLPPH